MTVNLYSSPQEMAEAAKTVYNEYAQDRDKFKDRAVDYSKITLPYILPDATSATSSEVMSFGYSSEGALGVNNLSNKYMSRLFPPNRNYFKLQPTLEAQLALEQQMGAEETLRILTTIEGRVNAHLANIEARPVLLEILKNLIITGNALMYLPKDGNLRMYALDQYVCTRTPDGDILTVITVDSMYLRSLPEEIQRKVMAELDIGEDEVRTKIVDIYTYIEKVGEDDYMMVQAAEGVYTGVTFNYNSSNLRWRPLVWHRFRKEHYGRGLVEDIYNELYVLGVITETFITAAAISADIKYIVDRAAGIDVAALNNSVSGTYHYGNADGVKPIQVNKFGDLELSKYLIEKATRSVGRAFLTLPSVMRDAERVTAAENRLLANELDQAHGGTFSTLGVDLQLPLTQIVMSDIDLSVDGTQIDIVITTGIDALGRGLDAENALLFMDDMTILNNTPDEVKQRLKLSPFMGYIGAGRDVPIQQFLMTEEEVQQAATQVADEASQRKIAENQAGQVPQAPQVGL